jgi:O-antigen/teichoic acid export membrane protein
LKRDHVKSFLPWVIADSAISLGSAILLALYVANMIGPVAFGVAGTAFLLGSFAETFVALPFSEALIQRRDLDERTTDAAFAGMLALGVLAFAGMAAIAWPLAHAFETPELAALILVQGVTCLLLGLRGVPEALLSRELQFRALAIRNIVAKLTSAVVAVGLVAWGAGAWSIVLSNVAFGLASTLMVLAVAARLPRPRPDLAATKSLLRFGVFSLADGMLWTATPRLFAFLVGHYQGMRALGLLSVGFRMNDAISALLAAVTARIALPIFARTAEIPGRLDAAFQQGSKLTVMISTPIFVGLAFVSAEVVELFLGADWTAAAATLVAVSLYSIANFARLLAPPAIKAVGKPHLLLWLNLIGLGYVGIGTVAAAPFGFEAQLAVWSSFGLVYFATSVILLRRATGMGWRAQVAPLLRPSAAALGMAAALWATSLQTAEAPAALALATKVGVGATSYALLLVLFERRFLASLVQLLTRRDTTA